MQACKTVAKMLEKAFNTSRVGMLFDGTGVPHLHAQLVPFHANLSHDKAEAERYRADNPKLAKHLTAADGPKMADEELDKIQKKIKDTRHEV